MLKYVSERAVFYVMFLLALCATRILSLVQDVRIITVALFGVLFFCSGLFVSSLDDRFSKGMRGFLRRFSADLMISWGICLIMSVFYHWFG